MKKQIKKWTSLLLCVLMNVGWLVCAQAAEITVLLGDADTDGEIAAADARIALRLSVGLEQATENLVRICDVDHDGRPTAADARVILRVSVRLDSLNNAKVTLTAYSDQTEPQPRDPSIFGYTPPPTPPVRADSDTFTFTVYGNGHGVGLSQWGAVIMANAGYNYAEILAYYFQGTHVAVDPTFQQTVFYNGAEYPVVDIVAAITAMEIGGIATSDEAIKAQAVAIYTLFKCFRYNGNSNNVGVAGFSSCTDRIRSAVASVIGQYVTLNTDPYGSPIQTVYSAFHAGASIDPDYAWGSGSHVPASVKTPFEYTLSGLTGVYRYNANGGRTFEVIDAYGNVTSQRQTEYFALVYVYPRSYIESKLRAYGINYDPAHPENWFNIVIHSESIDANRGYVKNIIVGDLMLSGVGKLSSALGLGFRSGCYTVTYNR